MIHARRPDSPIASKVASYALLLVVSSLSTACGDSGSGGGSGPTGAAPAGGASSNATSCDERCATRAASCGLPEAACAELCGAGPSDAAIACIEALPCTADESDVTDCMSSGGTGGGGTGECLPVGDTGCTEEATGDDDCCDLGECESGRCCYPSNFPSLNCTSDDECCTGTCQMDPSQNDVAVKYCQ
jgi:hypothetical protein